MDAQKALNFAHCELGLTWREIAELIGCYSPSYWMRVARGDIKMSRRADTAFRAVLGLAPRNVTRIADMAPAQLARAIRERTEITL